jgi:hypothetical protein
MSIHFYTRLRINSVEFQKWIVQKYVDWRKNKVGREGSVRAYAAYLGVSQQVVDSWINRGKVPKSKQAIDCLIARYESEVYDVLNIPAPATDTAGKQLSPLARLIARMADELPLEDQNEVIEFIESRRGKAARKDSGAHT